MVRGFRSGLAACSLLAAAACTPDFQSPSQVTDLRVLAIQQEADGGFADAFVDLATPSVEQVQVKALVVDPRARRGLVAHARICSVIRKWGGDVAGIAGADFGLLTAPTEEALMLKLAAYPDMLAGAAAGLAPHDIAFYARDLAGAYHSYYAAERVVGVAPELSRARVALLAATRQVLANALGMLGVSAPEQMNRDTAEATEPPQTPQTSENE